MIKVMSDYIQNDDHPIIVLHHTDLDGKCSAAVLRLWIERMHYHTIERFIPIDYGKELQILGPLLSEDLKNKIVVMLDFSVSEADLYAIKEAAYDFIWIDHHQTSTLKAFEDIPGVRDFQSGRAACAIVWELCFTAPPCYAVQLLSDYDVWNLAATDVLPFQYGMRSIPNAPAEHVWDRICSDPTYLVLDITDKGRAIYAYLQLLYQEMMTAGAFELPFANLRCIACNTGTIPPSSQMFKSVYDPTKHDAMLAFRYNGEKWVVSLYTTKPEFNMGMICKEYGGGGHPAAAGFTLSDQIMRDIIL